MLRADIETAEGPDMAATVPILATSDLTKTYFLPQGMFKEPLPLHAVSGVSLRIERGKTLRFEGLAARSPMPVREAAQTMSEYVIVLFVISATIMAALAFMSGVVASLINLAAEIIPS